MLVMEVMHPLEITFKRKMRNMTIHVYFDELEHLDLITDTVRGEGATVYEFELEDLAASRQQASVILTVKLAKRKVSHSAILSTIAELPCVTSVQELIS